MDVTKPTKRELNQVYYINREIDNLQRLIDRQADADVKSPVPDGMPHSVTNVPGKPTEAAALKLAELQEQLEMLQDRCRETKRDIMAYVMSMDDSFMRQIVILRCVELMSWKDVASYIGGNNSAESCRVAFYREFK